MAKRPYSTKYTARSNPRSYLLKGIPPTMWGDLQRQARKEHVSMRALILGLLEGWLLQRHLVEGDVDTWVDKAQEAAREANRPAYEAMQRRRSAAIRKA